MSNIIKLKSLMQSIDQSVDVLLTEIADQKKEIANLKNDYKIAVKQIEEYVTELEQIRNHYVNSNNNTK
jgi:hypothetical protein